MTSIEKTSPSLNIIGSTELIEVANTKKIPAKIDTGADTSAIWASHINMGTDGTLSFVLFDEESPLYTGEELSTENYRVRSVRSSHGDIQIRYRVELPIVLGGESFTTTFTLADRSRNNFPVLIGRHTLEGRFLVDVSRTGAERPKSRGSSHLNQELQDDPYGFHRKYLTK